MDEYMAHYGVCEREYKREVNEIIDRARKGDALRTPVVDGPWNARHSAALRRLGCIAFLAQIFARDKTFLARYRQAWITAGAPMDEIRKIFGW